MTCLPQNLLRYQRQRAVTGPYQLEGSQRGDYAACIVIPSLAEADRLPQTLHSLSNNPQELLQRSLIVVVVNQRADTDSAFRHDNEKTLARLKQFPQNKLQLAWVDACSPGRELPARQGVGLARKIGFDLALSQLNWQAKPLLISLDADTLVHPGYLAALFHHFPLAKQGGAVIPFRHSPADDPAQELAIRRYELYLRSYAYGLLLAGSPYAYTSIGSAFACTAQAYLQAGGMNRRQAGEDFYFLQQLAKTTGISQVQGGLVFPSPRPSTRVPFGTGRAVSAQTDGGTAPFTFCETASFALLREWLSLVNTHWQVNAKQLMCLAGGIDQRLRCFLEKLNIVEVWEQLQNNYCEKQQFINNFHCWFDGLRTRQLLTALASSKPGSEVEIINQLFVWGGLAEKNSATEQLTALEQLQGVTPQLLESFQADPLCQRHNNNGQKNSRPLLL